MATKHPKGSAADPQDASETKPRARLDTLLEVAKTDPAKLSPEELNELVGALEMRRQAELESPDASGSPFAEPKDDDMVVVQVPLTVQGLPFLIGRVQYAGRKKMRRSTWQQLRGMIYADYQAEMRRLNPRGNLTAAVESLHQFRHIGVKDVA